MNVEDEVDLMKKMIIGRKIGMTQVFAEDGAAIPVTAIEVEPSVITQKKTVEKDGYDAIQLGYGRIKQNKATKPLQGHFAKADKGCFRILKEMRCDQIQEYELGQEITLDIFESGEMVDITGTTKGKGFAGVIKRHGFRGGRSSHGSMFHRAPGSIGASAYPSRVFKGKKLPGQMGNKQKTVKNLMIWSLRPERNLILIRGAVPGARNGYLFIKQSAKA
ncbi:LSU ribosomal protein L3P [Syntrophus aciditrophicus SB]|uniref:Large ribosomal subunit protein uL3 n=2 Tax=Syntrophus TaxID=43773 RepID=RL3_SYNAS|nr:RecName: Full=Large ribosomal subunit protein uL3; AltName: Full=50S ribosomal protein L3 [Syntrophus aciditrophicus SB]ABC76180.1 LSU ribosomal protein L3P [Syntrophus aciditrophicus SB]OPY17607.1 MAG: 50S ribosomal protein L3 [Syntrophus sp. PtaB.Bin075]